MYDLLICNFVFSGVNELYNPGCKTQGVWGTITAVLPALRITNFNLQRPVIFVGISKCYHFMGSLPSSAGYSHTQNDYTIFIDKN
jgi:hypothetical protein